MPLICRYCLQVLETMQRAQLFVLCYPYLPMCCMLLDAVANSTEASTQELVANATREPMEAEWKAFLDYLIPLASDQSFFHEHVPLVRTNT